MNIFDEKSLPIPPNKHQHNAQGGKPLSPLVTDSQVPACLGRDFGLLPFPQLDL